MASAESFLEPPQFSELFNGRHAVLDVRAEIEFEKGAVPGAKNIPILENKERELVGTTYKQNGQDVAIELGHQLVSGGVRAQRIRAWRDCLSSSSRPILFCARGGMRSSLAQAWLEDCGLQTRRVRGGYKAIRNYLLDVIEHTSATRRIVTLGGYTGSGKTSLLLELSVQGQAVLDLEKRAKHRGSAFGGFETPQPSQASFENRLAADLLQFSDQQACLFIEDESRAIGNLRVPKNFFDAALRGPLVVVEVPLDERVRIITKEYVEEPLEVMTAVGVEQPFRVLGDKLEANVQKLGKRLGGQRCQDVRDALRSAMTAFSRTGDASSHGAWIEPLLSGYYDKCYEYQLAKSDSRIVFRGDRSAVRDFLATYRQESRVYSRANARMGHVP